MSVDPRRRFGSAFAALASLNLTACPGTIENRERFEDASGTGCSAPLDVPTAIFKRDCNNAICHDSVQPAGGLDLDSPGVLGRLIGVPATECTDQLLIDPVRPDQSFLLEKLESRAPECGDQMPLVGSLPPNVIECVREWVHLVVGGGVDGGAGTDAARDSGSGDAADGSSEQ